MNRIKCSASVIIFLISTVAFAQKKISAEFMLQPGISFISGDWKNPEAFGAPAFKKSITPALETGVRAIFNLKGKTGSKVVYDEMYGSNSYLAEKVTFTVGLFYSFCGQRFKDMKMGDITWSRKVSLQYLKVPFKFELIKGNEGDNQLIYSAGFYLGYLINYKETNSKKQNTNELVTVAHGNEYDSTYNGTTFKRHFQSTPYQSLDYGLSLGVGMQKLISDHLFLQVMLNGQLGLANILNANAQINDGTNVHSYFNTKINTIVPRKNSSLELMIGIKKRFEWTPSSKEHKRWRIFRLKE